MNTSIFNNFLRFSSIIVLIFSSSPSFSQTRIDDLKTTIQKCSDAFENGDIEDIKLNFPLVEQQQLILAMQKGKYKRNKGRSEIIKIYTDSALVLLTGTFIIGNSGDETDYSNVYSGIYVFKPVNGVWKMSSKIPIDRLNRLKSHHLDFNVDPLKATIAVRDTMEIVTVEKHGFLVALNHKAKIIEVLLNRKKVNFIFDGGVLWLASQQGLKGKLILAYTLNVDQDSKNENSGYFDANFGHLRDQFYWHPFFNFSSSNDLADFHIRASIPSSYHMSAGIAQTEQVVGNQRIINAKSAYPTFALSLYYDSEWTVTTLNKGDYKLQIFGNTNFKPVPDSLYQSFSETYELLSERFGKPQGNYLSIVQNRSKNFPIWLNRSNDMIVAGNQGSYMITNKAKSPQAPFGHEVAHAWTRPIGPATNFLREGWASFAESYLLGKMYGDTTVKRFFANYKTIYFNNGFDGKTSLWEDSGNSGISYYKGVWVFYMLRNQLGSATFDKGLKTFIQSQKPMDIAYFIKCLSDVAGKDLKPVIEPWLKSKQVPHVNKILKGNELLIEQEGDVFIFPLEVSLLLKDGNTVLQSFTISKNKQSFKLNGFSTEDVSSITLDPSNKLLIKVKSNSK